MLYMVERTAWSLMGLAPSSLLVVTQFLSDMSTNPVKTVNQLIHPQRAHSMRKRAWYVEPINTSTGSVNDDSHNAQWVDKKGKVLCGYLFNGESERCQLGLTTGAGEECPISLEPIADARLPFSTNICVDSSNPQLTGVELLCSHRFSAVFLLWHWARAPMVCPICRAHFSLEGGGVLTGTPGQNVPSAENTRLCMVENFPRKHWVKLRAIIRKYKKEEEMEERRLMESYETESVLDETLETVLGNVQQFFMMISLSNGDGRDIIQYMPLHRTNDNITAITEDTFRFSVQRSALRRFTTAVSNMDNMPSLNNNHGGEQRLMRSSVVLRVGSDDNEHSYLFRVAQLADVELPAFCLHDRVFREGPILHRTNEVNQVETNPVAENPRSSVVPLVTTTDTLGSTATSRTSVYRYTTVNASCIDMDGLLTMEICEESQNTGIDSLHSVTLSLQACAFMSEVARCLSN